MERRTRLRVLAAVVAVVAATLALQAATAAPATGVIRTDGGAYPGNTLVAVQGYGSFYANNGEAFVVTPEGEVVWEFDPPNSRVFDAEMLENGNVLVSVATAVPARDCPEEHRATARYPSHCVHNRVLELDFGTKAPVWKYEWYDAFTHWHEVHDADRLPSGETAVVDMGNDRAFTVDRNGEITWEWRAEDHIGPGTDFWERYVPEGRRDEYRKNGPHADWTHLNDIDRLPNGHFQLSIRNFDVIVEVDPRTGGVVDVIGRPGRYGIMREQHDPHRLAAGTLLIADSENNRVVERDLETGEAVWSYTGGPDRLQWPRDADRLPNGNTLIVDSRNARVLEINATGEVVWGYSLRREVGIVYDADRIGVPEEPADAPSGRRLAAPDRTGPFVGTVRYVESWAAFVFPPWVRAPELATILVGVLALLGLSVDVVRAALARRHG